ncbi:preprotein translocase subunit SecE [Candidatus Uhrbacteria bacterium]|nr:preprotein translocase subunit SecE [Candidatus Uhrbacteria bacterium]
MASFSLTNNPAVNYVKESNTELRKVVWPSRKTVVKHTLLVIGAAVVMGAFFGALDFGLVYGFEKILQR